MRRTHFRIRSELSLRKFSRAWQDVRFSIGQSYPATTDRAGTDEKIARDGKNRPARPFYFPQGQAIQSLSGIDRQERCRIRIREARAKIQERTKIQRAGREN